MGKIRGANGIPVESANGGALQVLIVDDSDVLRSVIRRFLEQRGHVVIDAMDGEEALRIVKEQPVDCVIVDVHMPRTDGPTFFTELGRVAPDMQRRTVFMTGGVTDQGLAELIARSGRPALYKPFGLAAVALAIESAAG